MHPVKIRVKQLFHIENNIERIQPVLSIMFSDKYVVYTIADKEAGMLYLLNYCTVEEWSQDTLDDFFNAYPELGDNYYQVLISYHFHQSMLVPALSYRKSEGGTFLTGIFGAGDDNSVVSEAIPEWQLYNVYAVPDQVHDRLKKQFPKATFRHQVSLELRNTHAASAEGCLQLDFTTEYFTVLVLAQSKLLFSGRFEYTSPSDVLYYLIKICNVYSLDQQAAQLFISGLIDTDSALYKELHGYFIQIKFREAGWKNLPDYPSHYFTSINELAKCAS